MPPDFLSVSFESFVFETKTESLCSMYTVSRTTLNFSLLTFNCNLSRTLSRSVTVATRRVSPLSLRSTVMVVVTVTVSCTSTATLSRSTLNSSLSTLNCELCSLLLACRLTLQLFKHRAVSAMRAVADALNRIPQLGHFLP